MSIKYNVLKFKLIFVCTARFYVIFAAIFSGMDYKIKSTLFSLFMITCQVQAQVSDSIISVFDTAKVHPVNSDRGTFNTLTYGQNLQVITQADIQMLPVQTTAEVLTYVLGVDVRQRAQLGVQSDIQIQGSTFDQVLILIDGVKMSDPQTGHHQMNLSISPEAIERIEVIKGAAARRYGLNALAGVVNIITKLPKSYSTIVQVHGGSGGTKNSKKQLYANQSVRLFNAFGHQNLSAWFDVNADLSNGYRHNSDFQSLRANFRVRQMIPVGSKAFNSDGILINFSGGTLYNAFGANGFYAAPADSNAYEYVNTQWGSLSADISTKRVGHFVLRLNGRINHDQYVFVKSNPALYRNFHQTSVINPELNYKYAGKFYEFGLGVEYRKEAINSTNLGIHFREFTGAFLDLSFTPIKDVKISGGLYHLSNKIIGSRIYPGADLNVRFYKQMYVFASYGTGQRLPTFTDLYYTGPSNLSNPLLKSELANYADIGLKGHIQNLNVQVSVFRRRNANLIDRVRDSLNAPWMPVNVQSMDVSGWEANLAYKFNIRQVFRRQGGAMLRIQSGLSALSSSMLSTQSISQFTLNYLPLQVMSQVSFQGRQFGLTYNFRYIERYGLKAQEKDAYYLMDIRIDYRIKTKGKTQFSTWISVQNIANTQYKDFIAIPLLPRWFSIGVTARLR